MVLALTIVHVIIALALIVVVLLQHGKQQGLSGAIAGGAETFFGKNKGRTVDAMLKKFTAVVAILFIVSSVVLAAVSIQQYDNAAAPGTDASEALPIDVNEDGSVTAGENGEIPLTDAEGAVTNEDGAVTDENADGAADAGAADGTEANTDASGAADDGAANDAAENPDANADTNANTDANPATAE